MVNLDPDALKQVRCHEAFVSLQRRMRRVRILILDLANECLYVDSQLCNEFFANSLEPTAAVRFTACEGVAFDRGNEKITHGLKF